MHEECNSITCLILFRVDLSSRWGGQQGKAVDGEDLGRVGSDFSCGYKIHQGLHQRCWVHFLRDVPDLKDDFPEDEELRDWAKDVKAVYEQAVAWAGQEPEPACLHANSSAFA